MNELQMNRIENLGVTNSYNSSCSFRTPTVNVDGNTSAENLMDTYFRISYASPAAF